MGPYVFLQAADVTFTHWNMKFTLINASLIYSASLLKDGSLDESSADCNRYTETMSLIIFSTSPTCHWGNQNMSVTRKQLAADKVRGSTSPEMHDKQPVCEK